MKLSRLDRWLLRAACVAVCLLALYAYSTAVVNFAVWRMQTTQAVNALLQTAKPAGPGPAQSP